MLTPGLIQPPARSGVSSRLLSLDGLRGLAVLLVLLDHASDAQLRLFPAADLNRAGKYGVYLFFVLSAFLLTHLQLRRPLAELADRRTWLDYALRRFLRIFPLYALVLLVMVANHSVLPDLLTHLSLLDGKKQFWTIPVEVKYYLILPLGVLALSAALHRAWRFAAIAGAVAISVAAAVFAAERAWSLNEVVHLSRNLAPFLLGSAAALGHRFLLPRAAGLRLFAGWLDAAAILALLGIAFRIPAIYNALGWAEPVHKFSYDPLVCGLLWAVVLIGTLHGAGFMRAMLEMRPLRYVGLVSYSAYLWHQKFLTDVDDLPLPLPLRLLCFLGLVLAVASVSYFLIERPLGRIHFRHRAKPVIAAPVAVAAA